MQYDIQIVNNSGKEDIKEKCQILNQRSMEILLMGGSKSHPWLKVVLDELKKILFKAKFLELPNVGHTASFDNPKIVAPELSKFFGDYSK